VVGARWAEGPAGSRRAASRLVGHSEQSHDAVRRTLGRRLVFREHSNNSNGNTVDNQGRLVTCEHLTRRVTRTEFDGSISIIAENVTASVSIRPRRRGEVGRFDLVHRPRYGIDTDYEGDRAAQEIEGCHVYRVDAKSGAVTAVITDMVRPKASPSRPTRNTSTSPTPARRTKRNGPATFAASRSTLMGPSCRAARFSPSRPRACSTVSASIGMAASGPALQRASIAMTGRLADRQNPHSELVANVTFGGTSSTACSSAERHRSIRSTLRANGCRPG